MTVVARLDVTGLDRIRANLRPKASRIIRETGFKVASDAAMGAPVDTGALRNSILAESAPVNDYLFMVQDGVEYGIFQELGTSRMAAQPFLVPAVEANDAEFKSRWAELFE